MLVSPLSCSFLDTSSLSTSSQVCNALFMFISFLVLWSICLSSSLVHFKLSHVEFELVLLVLFSVLLMFINSRMAHIQSLNSFFDRNNSIYYQVKQRYVIIVKLIEIS